MAPYAALRCWFVRLGMSSHVCLTQCPRAACGTGDVGKPKRSTAPVSALESEASAGRSGCSGSDSHTHSSRAQPTPLSPIGSRRVLLEL